MNPGLALLATLLIDYLIGMDPRMAFRVPVRPSLIDDGGSPCTGGIPRQPLKTTRNIYEKPMIHWSLAYNQARIDMNEPSITKSSNLLIKCIINQSFSAIITIFNQPSSQAIINHILNHHYHTNHLIPYL